MKHAGFNSEELSKVYRNIVRPVADYMLVVYHSMLTDLQDERIERLQAQALKFIYGKDVKYSEMRERAGVSTLRARRVEACDKFAAKCSEISRFGHWFPRKAAPSQPVRGKRPEIFVEKFARCDRLCNSPLHYMRRRLNGKDGKLYGARNRKYRE